MLHYFQSLPMNMLTKNEHSEKEISWSLPIPLINEDTSQSPPYPIDALPNIVRDAVVTYQQYGQQPLPLIACSALGNISLACQTLANVARDRLLISPVSLYFIVVANSGERKTAADHIFSQAIRKWEQNIIEQLTPEVNKARSLHYAWRAEKDGVLNQIRNRSLKEQVTDALKEHFVNIMAKEPHVPLLPTLFFEDATQEALAFHIANGWPSASLWSDEGGIIIHGQGMQNNANKFVALLNRLWDGKSFISHRKTTSSFTISDRRLTLSIMMQPLILQQMLAKNNGISRQSGFLARGLICYPQSSMGERFYKEPPESLHTLSLFHQRLQKCLDQSLSLDKIGCNQLPTLLLSKQAKLAWIDFFNNIEQGLKLSHKWVTVKDFASKAAENLVRLAALFHLFEEQDGDITSENIERASQVINWHLLETKRIINIRAHSAGHAYALKLLSWIKEKKLTTTTARYLQQYSPIRNKNHRNAAIHILLENYYLKELQEAGKTILVINPKI
jgi:hypothetical protein